ncbi:hypothetical protein SPRG_00941 [Saprolegnia parasitica CBS 223.65]|uniref:Transmembrane protein n=1 Tax=Saprolegnia parasitica (strain CBS 223.65) TaxID=695850 RepID=A0A067D798_SAPPC|nr:hypothetical protein SPRG_00941 [Saprolegnia parasitica CBS 223.65]KDO34882.1 hypothetical protein SPRG_00941 [Saprolegnia parasitica CBS 223.65]|eukprot:XP_012194543.1 hypothetical protein SPRG_00941 [Saprolegnia parasitica CBS 223.65]
MAMVATPPQAVHAASSAVLDGGANDPARPKNIEHVTPPTGSAATVKRISISLPNKKPQAVNALVDRNAATGADGAPSGAAHVHTRHAAESIEVPVAPDAAIEPFDDTSIRSTKISEAVGPTLAERVAQAHYAKETAAAHGALLSVDAVTLADGKFEGMYDVPVEDGAEHATADLGGKRARLLDNGNYGDATSDEPQKVACDPILVSPNADALPLTAHRRLHTNTDDPPLAGTLSTQGDAFADESLLQEPRAIERSKESLDESSSSRPRRLPSKATPVTLPSTHDEPASWDWQQAVDAWIAAASASLEAATHTSAFHWRALVAAVGDAYDVGEAVFWLSLHRTLSVLDDVSASCDDLLANSEDARVLLANTWGAIFLSTFGAVFAGIYVLFTYVPTVAVDFYQTLDDLAKVKVKLTSVVAVVTALVVLKAEWWFWLGLVVISLFYYWSGNKTDAAQAVHRIALRRAHSV